MVATTQIREPIHVETVTRFWFTFNLWTKLRVWLRPCLLKRRASIFAMLRLKTLRLKTSSCWILFCGSGSSSNEDCLSGEVNPRTALACAHRRSRVGFPLTPPFCQLECRRTTAGRSCEPVNATLSVSVKLAAHFCRVV